MFVWSKLFLTKIFTKLAIYSQCSKFHRHWPNKLFNKHLKPILSIFAKYYEYFKKDTLLLVSLNRLYKTFFNVL